MSEATITILLNGATGRICRTQHLERALLPIRESGGIVVGDMRIVPDLVLVGRSEEKLRALADRYGIGRWTTDLASALSAERGIYFDAALTEGRAARLKQAVEAGWHIYSEKPVVEDAGEGRDLLDAVREAGIRHGVVEDKLYLPGMRKLKTAADQDFFGRVVGFQLTFGYWVFAGDTVPCQRSSWNYRRERGGGQINDMFPHWRYLIEGILGPISEVVTAAWTATPSRIDEAGVAYEVDVEDSAATLVRLESGTIGTIVSTGATRVRRDDLLTLQIDGTAGSAVAGLHRCALQPLAATPMQRWDTDIDHGVDYRAGWIDAPAVLPASNPFRIGWEVIPHACCRRKEHYCGPYCRPARCSARPSEL